MKLKHYIALIAIMLPYVMFAAHKKTPLFMFGIATSFNDSTVYITEIQQTEGWLEEKTGFLYSRDNYSYQLRDNLKAAGVDYPTCVTVFAKKRKDIEKKYVAMKKNFITKRGYSAKFLSASDFSYTVLTPDEDTQYKNKAKKVKKTKKKKAAKEGE